MLSAMESRATSDTAGLSEEEYEQGAWADPEDPPDSALYYSRIARMTKNRKHPQPDVCGSLSA